MREQRYRVYHHNCKVLGVKPMGFQSWIFYMHRREKCQLKVKSQK